MASVSVNDIPATASLDEHAHQLQTLQFFPLYRQPRRLERPAIIAVYVLPAINAGSVLGRSILGFVADKVGSLKSMIPCGFAGICARIRMVEDSHRAWYPDFQCSLLILFRSYSILAGDRIYTTLTGLNQLEPVRAWLFTCAGFGFLIGNQIAGALLDIPKAQCHDAQIFTAVALSAGLTAFVIVWVLLASKEGVLKAKF